MESEASIYIVGSGLSAISAAAALVRRGCHPTVLDSGLSPDVNALRLKTKLAATDPEEWSQEDLHTARHIGPVAANGIPRKLYFGSDFVFQGIPTASKLDVGRASIHRSFAAGGFSNIWGAVIQPLPAGEFRDWPVCFTEMAPHYAAVHALISSGRLDAKTDELNDSPVSQLLPSSQARALYSDLWRNRQKLKKEGIRFDYAKLALGPCAPNGDKQCCYCGLCLHGCPYDCKYTASATLSQLIRDDRIRYIPGIMVDKLRIGDKYLQIESTSLKDGTPCSFRCKCVVLAAGFLESSRIILGSLGLNRVQLRLKHSDIFTLPIVRYRTPFGVKSEKLHTLCQLVMQLDDPAVCPHPIHLQLYGYNDLYQLLIARRLGLFSRPLTPIVRAFETRLIVIFGYLHSSISSSITMSLAGDRNHGIRLEGHPSTEAQMAARAVACKLLRNHKYLQAIPLGYRLRLDLPGGGYHSGGAFPMREKPGALETDRLGSLASLPGVHVVDSSVFPDISSFPTAFTAMANAHRIASEIELPHGN